MLNNSLLQFNNGMNAAVQELQRVKQAREVAGFSGSSSYVDKIGPTMDCVLRFLDDLYERKTLQALSTLERVPIDQLWIGTDMDVNVKRVERWNACKAKFGEPYQRTKVLLQDYFPTRPIDAVYKKCNHCGCVFVKPVGCDFGTTCGKSIGGADTIPFAYDYNEERNHFRILDNSSMGPFESVAYQLRRSFASMVSRNTYRFYYGSREEEVEEYRPRRPQGRRDEPLDKGCGRGIKWETMIPLTIEELSRHGLLPEGVQYEVTPPERAGADLSMQQKLQKMAEEMGIAPGGSAVAQVKELFAQMGVDAAQQPPKLADQVDMLYNMIIDVSSS